MSESAFRVLRKDVWMLGGEIGQAEGLDFFKAITSTPPDREICLLVDSPGGNYSSAHGIIHHLAKRPSLEIRVVGEACSAALDIVALGGALRTSVPGAVFLAHPTSLFAELHPNSSQDIGAVMKAEDDRRARLYAKRTGKTFRFWQKFFEQDSWFNTERALELGLIDQVLTRDQS